MNDWNRLARQAESYRARFPKGSRVELICMGDDPRPVEPGTKGTVVWVDDIGTVHVDFDNGRKLGLIPGEDSFRRID